MGETQGEGAHLPQEDRIATGILLERHGIRADKRLGQHFLVSSKVVQAIVSRAQGLHVLEIGPGIGVLTAPLCRECASVTAIELDKRFVEVLHEVAPIAEVVHADALNTDWRTLLERTDGGRCIVSNMPYNITGPLLAKVADCRDLIGRAILMMQKEVGARVLAKEGTPERGALSVVMQLQFDVVKVCDAKAGAFLPPPKVDSIVLEFTPRPMTQGLEKTLSVVKLGFTQPRKTLANNLSSVFDREKIGLSQNIRPHQLSNDEWMALAARL